MIDVANINKKKIPIDSKLTSNISQILTSEKLLGHENRFFSGQQECILWPQIYIFEKPFTREFDVFNNFRCLNQYLS